MVERPENLNFLNHITFRALHLHGNFCSFIIFVIFIIILGRESQTRTDSRQPYISLAIVSTVIDIYSSFLEGLL